jgi:hypothetical protein
LNQATRCSKIALDASQVGAIAFAVFRKRRLPPPI